jgi:hypothetical protein
VSLLVPISATLDPAAIKGPRLRILLLGQCQRPAGVTIHCRSYTSQRVLHISSVSHKHNKGFRLNSLYICKVAASCIRDFYRSSSIPFLTQDWLLHQIFDSSLQPHYHSCSSTSASTWANGKVEHRPRPPHLPVIRWHPLHHIKEPLPPVMRRLFDVRIAF